MSLAWISNGSYLYKRYWIPEKLSNEIKGSNCYR